MINLKNKQQVAKIAEVSKVLAEVLHELVNKVAPGVTTAELDDYARKRIEKLGGAPSFYGYRGYPASICASVDDAVIHGIPNAAPLRAGQIVGIDCGIVKDGYYSDAAVTVGVGDISSKVAHLLDDTAEALHNGIAAATASGKISDISKAVETVGLRCGYGIIEEYCGHGVGLAIHEEPSITNTSRQADNSQLRAGMVLAIEPMFCLGSPGIYVADDKWTVQTRDGTPAAHFEHTIAVTEHGPEILTACQTDTPRV